MTVPLLHRSVSPSSLLNDAGARAEIEGACLPPFLVQQRWYSGKARQAASVRIADWGALGRGDTPSFLLLVDVTYAEGGVDRFFVPVAIDSGAEAAAVERDAPGALIARLPGPGQRLIHGHVRDEDAVRLVEAIESADELGLGHGTIRAEPTSAFAACRGPAPVRELAVHRLSGEQSNTSVLVGDRLILKLIRRVEPGLNPEYEIGRHLTERVGFERVPRLAGALDHHAEDGTQSILGVLQDLVPHRSNAWEHAVDEAAAFLDRVSTLPEPPASRHQVASLLEAAGGADPPDVIAKLTDYRDMAALLGRRTGELHVALATDAGDPAFQPEPLGPSGLAALAREMTAHGREALDALAAAATRVPATVAPRVQALLERGDTLLDRFQDVGRVDPEIAAIRVHGDYHLGQVLWTGRDFVILDFEGEPLRPLEERRRKHAAMKDVAGMLRSFSYAAYAALFRRAAEGRHDESRLEPWARVWQTWTSVAFLRAYLQSTEGTAFQPRHAASADVLLRAFLLDKALYELLYELNNRPSWLRIPLYGILGVI